MSDKPNEKGGEKPDESHQNKANKAASSKGSLEAQEAMKAGHKQLSTQNTQERKTRQADLKQEQGIDFSKHTDVTPPDKPKER